MRLNAPKLFTLALLALLGAACQDVPTAPVVHTPPPTFNSPAFDQSASASASSPYQCYTSVRTPEGPYRYAYGRMELHFPKKALASNGRTRLYLLPRAACGRRATSGGQLPDSGHGGSGGDHARALPHRQRRADHPRG